MKTVEVSAMILILLLASSIASVSALTNFSFGGKSGDWIEYELEEAFYSASQEWEKMQYLNVTGTTVTVQATVYTTTLTLINENWTVNLASQDDVQIPIDLLSSARVYFIPGGLSVGDSVYLGTTFGNIIIMGQTTGSYAGADRTVIYTNFTTPQGYNYFFYWDKQTGVLTEGTMTLGSVSNVVLADATNMWGGIAWWLWIVLWIVIIITIAVGVLSSRKKRSEKVAQKSDARPTLTKVALFRLFFKKEKLIETHGFI